MKNKYWLLLLLVMTSSWTRLAAQDHIADIVKVTQTKINSILRSDRGVEKTFGDLILPGDSLADNRVFTCTLSSSMKYHLNAFAPNSDISAIAIAIYVKGTDKLDLVTDNHTQASDVTLNFEPKATTTYFVVVSGLLRPNIKSSFFSLIIDSVGSGEGSGSDYTSAIIRHISTVHTNISSAMKDTFVLRRVESGLLTENQDILYSTSTRRLSKGNSYMIGAFTDDRIKSFSFGCYRKNFATNKWDLVKMAPDAGTPPKDHLLGESKYLTLTVYEDGLYLFQISANKKPDHSTGGFAMMMYSTPQLLGDSGGNGGVSGGSGSQGSGNSPASGGGADGVSTFFSIEGYDLCQYDSVNKSFNNCTPRPGEASLFELNGGRTMFTHTTPTMTSRYYIQSKQFDAQHNLYTYEVLSDVGNKYIFYLPAGGRGFVSIFDEQGNKSYIIKYHIKRSWTGEK